MSKSESAPGSAMGRRLVNAQETPSGQRAAIVTVDPLPIIVVLYVVNAVASGITITDIVGRVIAGGDWPADFRKWLLRRAGRVNDQWTKLDNDVADVRRILSTSEVAGGAGVYGTAKIPSDLDSTYSDLERAIATTVQNIVEAAHQFELAIGSQVDAEPESQIADWRDRLDQILSNRNQPADRVLADLAELMRAIQRELRRHITKQISETPPEPLSPGLSSQELDLG